MPFNKEHILYLFRKAVSRNKAGTRLAIRIRNQVQKIIAYSLAESAVMEQNGEAFLLQQLSAGIGLAIDAGAHTGEWTSCLLGLRNSYTTTVHLFEPGDPAFRELEKKFAEQESIVLNHCGLLEHDGVATFFENDLAARASGFVAMDAIKKGKELSVTSINSYCKARAIQSIDFLKVDCEGCDFFVLKGSDRLLKENAIRFIQFEYGPAWARAGATLGAACTLLEKYNYQLFAIRPNGIQRFSYERLGEFFNYCNFFAVRQQDRQLVSPLEVS